MSYRPSFRNRTRIPEKLIMEALPQKWPVKQAEVELAVRKLKAELGFVPVEG
jgi:hypothetical protein